MMLCTLTEYIFEGVRFTGFGKDPSDTNKVWLKGIHVIFEVQLASDIALSESFLRPAGWSP